MIPCVGGQELSGTCSHVVMMVEVFEEAKAGLRTERRTKSDEQNKLH